MGKFLVIFLSLLSCVGYAKVTFVTFPIPLMVESAEVGLFIDLTKEISKRTKTDILIQVMPTGRAILSFSKGQANAFFPALDVYTPTNAIKTVPFYEKIDYVFYRKEKPLKTIKDLEGKKVGLTFRYPYAVKLTANKKIKFVFSEDDVSNMKKLSDGNIDAFVVEERSGLRALELSRVNGITFDRQTPLSKQDVYYAFEDTEEGRRLAKEFSAVIMAMKANGSLDEAILRSKK
ncbi:substrate-binding periplasmic protein [Bdellovibrio sp. GT3]|uniref:substrate-binding periplasmic protein n=1 Tax=Bdellovibrio sp. GT3 TaxID=3136282 RepID=UPI0030F3AF5B